ncbi:hypothetical protein B0H17DRAFT_1108321, partial [Mycena rosella]
RGRLPITAVQWAAIEPTTLIVFPATQPPDCAIDAYPRSAGATPAPSARR